MQERFCVQCGEPLLRRVVAGRERPVCPECGWVLFHDPKVAAVCVVPMGERLVMVRRGLEPGLGLWGLPGGYVDRGEVVERAAEREVWEETGLRVRVQDLLTVLSDEGHPVVVVAYWGRVVDGTLAPGPEVLEVGLFSPDDLPALAFERDRIIIARWLDVMRRQKQEGGECSPPPSSG